MKSMNKILSSLFAVCAFIILMSCSEDEEAAIATEADLAGTWTMQSSEIDFKINGKDIVDYMIETFEMSEEEAKAQKEAFEGETEMESGTTIELKSNHTYISKSAGDDPDNGTWKLINDGKKLLIDEGTDDEMEFEIKSISGSNLSLFTQRSEKEDFDQDGTDDTIEVQMTINLKK